jgi:hypothetical protein
MTSRHPPSRAFQKFFFLITFVFPATLVMLTVKKRKLFIRRVIQNIFTARM